MHHTSMFTATPCYEAYPVPGLGSDEPIGNRPIARNGAYRKSPQIVGTVLASTTRGKLLDYLGRRGEGHSFLDGLDFLDLLDPQVLEIADDFLDQMLGRGSASRHGHALNVLEPGGIYLRGIFNQIGASSRSLCDFSQAPGV